MSDRGFGDRVAEAVEVAFPRASRWAHELSPRRHLRVAWERWRKGYALEDTFSFEEYLAKVINGGVLELRYQEHGHPEQVTMQEWNDILIDIAEGFRYYMEAGGFPTAPEEQAKMRKSLDLFCYWFPHLWD